MPALQQLHAQRVGRYRIVRTGGVVDQHDRDRPIVVKCALNYGAQAGVANEGHGQRGHRQAGDPGGVALSLVAVEVQRQVGRLSADAARRGRAGRRARWRVRTTGVVERERRSGLRFSRHAVQRAAVDGPATVCERCAVARRARHIAPQKAAAGVEAAVGLELRVLIERVRANRGAATHEQIGITQSATMLLQHLDQRAGEDAADAGLLLRQLAALAGGQQDVAAGRHRKPGVGLIQPGVVAVQVAGQRALGQHVVCKSRRQAAEGVHLPCGRPRMAAIEQHGHFGVAVGQLGDQYRKFLVGQVVATRPAAVEAHQTFVHAIRKQCFEGRVGCRSRAMAAVVEHGAVTRLGPAQMAAKQRDDVGAGGLTVLQHFNGGTGSAGSVLCQVGLESIHVAQATGQLADALRIIVDAHQQRVGPVRHALLPVASHRRRQWLAAQSLVLTILAAGRDGLGHAKILSIRARWRVTLKVFMLPEQGRPWHLS